MNEFIDRMQAIIGSEQFNNFTTNQEEIATKFFRVNGRNFFPTT